MILKLFLLGGVALTAVGAVFSSSFRGMIADGTNNAFGAAYESITGKHRDTPRLDQARRDLKDVQHARREFEASLPQLAVEMNRHKAEADAHRAKVVEATDKQQKNQMLLSQEGDAFIVGNKAVSRAQLLADKAKLQKEITLYQALAADADAFAAAKQEQMNQLPNALAARRLKESELWVELRVKEIALKQDFAQRKFDQHLESMTQLAGINLATDTARDGTTETELAVDYSLVKRSN